ncbi:hypothetical protein [Actinomadura rayongensis]|uniref:Uncharacterized protein n=1 Tax=Actinomadura rayongensis TaxID=1429076 RepID=A0A6I4WDJ3_9ACTN|nr:hypothetical protein [Actinomadura rayongensis]MXQ67741.1 hypothetical protein [Actinomadura rayongensis]
MTDHAAEPAHLSPEEARALTEQIRAAGAQACDLIVRAYEGRAWAALDYRRWRDYCTTEFGADRMPLTPAARRDLVLSLSDAGLSTRATSAVTGLGRTTVSRARAGLPALAPESAAGPGSVARPASGRVLPRRPADQVINHLVWNLRGMVQVLPDLDASITPAQAAQWADDLGASVRTLRRYINLMREYSRAS